MYLRWKIVAGLLALGIAGLCSADTLSVLAGTVQGTVVLDSALAPLSFDIRTPAGLAILENTTGGELAVSDALASPTFGNVFLSAADAPLNQAFLSLTFFQSTFKLLSPAEFQIDAVGTLIAGTPNAIDQEILGANVYTFATTAVSTQPDGFIVTADLTSVATTTAPEPVSAGLLAAGGLLFGVSKLMKTDS